MLLKLSCVMSRHEDKEQAIFSYLRYPTAQVQ